jgi:hypothetical protein
VILDIFSFRANGFQPNVTGRRSKSGKRNTLLYFFIECFSFIFDEGRNLAK